MAQTPPAAKRRGSATVSEAPDRSNDLDRADMLRLASGHDAALNDIMERHGLRLYNYLLRSLQNEEDAADLAQETFLRVYQNRGRFDSNRKFLTWLYAIAANLVRNQFRYRTRHPKISLDAASDGTGGQFSEKLPEQKPIPSESLLAGERAEAVRQAVSELPEQLRTPLILAEYQELSCEQIASILSSSTKAVENRLYRARKQLKSALARFLA
jgi:RNA polymerase sigma-70 factor, ECF subfamily